MASVYDYKFYEQSRIYDDQCGISQKNNGLAKKNTRMVPCVRKICLKLISYRDRGYGCFDTKRHPRDPVAKCVRPGAARIL